MLEKTECIAMFDFDALDVDLEASLVGSPSVEGEQHAADSFAPAARQTSTTWVRLDYEGALSGKQQRRRAALLAASSEPPLGSSVSSDGGGSGIGGGRPATATAPPPYPSLREARDPDVEWLAPEVEEGNVEYKFMVRAFACVLI